jgi:hypothetical protein
LRLDKDKWQKAFEKELDKAEKRQSSKVRRYYKNQYYKGAESFLSSGQTSFQLLFNTSELIKIYRDLYSDIGLQFAKWYARNFDKYIKKGVNPNQYVDEWQNSFASYGSAVGAERVTLVSGTAKATLVKVTQNLMTDLDFQNLGIAEKTRILRSQFNRYSAFQAERLVRTEATSAANFATLKSANTIFPAEDLQKEWISATDERTRPTHRAVNGVVVNQTDFFTVGDSLMMYPGDPRGSAKEVINCRCSIAPFPKETAQATGEISDIGFGVSFGANQKPISNSVSNALSRGKIISEYEKSIKNQNFESAALYDDSGNLIFKKDGGAQNVKFSDYELEQMKGKHLTHNHPLDQSFSAEDIHVLSYWGLSEIRAVTKTRTFVMKSNKQFTNKKEFSQLKSFITRTTNKIQKKLEKMYNSGQITLDEYYYMGMDEIWKEFSKSKKYKDIFTYDSF